jgi:nanoRNase/pAp phosphatase (c-di-AMP/oligoRNAs hydrolase)
MGSSSVDSTQSRGDVPSRLVGGGDIVRAENRYMVKLLQPPLELVKSLLLGGEAGAILVDSLPSASNHLLISAAAQLVAVVDHHLPPTQDKRLLSQDIRPHVAASATIVASYLREQNLIPSASLATALRYAIRAETRGAETHFSLWTAAYSLGLPSLRTRLSLLTFVRYKDSGLQIFR